MKKAIMIIIAAALVLLTVSCTTKAAAEDFKATGEYKGYEYSISTVGMEMFLDIEGNPTTGYQWMLLTESGSFTVMSSDYTQGAAPAGMTGVGGTYHFVIVFTPDAEQQLDFSYCRSWDPSDNPVDLSLKVTLKGSRIVDVSVVD